MEELRGAEPSSQKLTRHLLASCARTSGGKGLPMNSNLANAGKFAVKFLLIFSPLFFGVEEQIKAEEPSAAVSTVLARAGCKAYSGPSEQYPATNLLEAGAELRVFRQQGEWLAIQPPASAYSWVDRRFVKINEDKTGEVTAEGATSRLGSQFEERRNVYQVRLHRGERLALLGGDDGRWLRIAPPAGEFRWVRLDQVDSRKQLSTNSKNSDAVTSARSESTEQKSTSAEAFVETSAALQQPPKDASNETEVTDGVLPETRILDIGYQGASAPHEPAFRSREESVDFSAELSAIDLAIAEQLLKPRTQWRLDELANRAKIVAHAADSAEQRGKAAILSERVERLQRVRSGYNYLAMARGGTLARQDAKPISELADKRSSVGYEPEYDGVGRLRPVLASRGDAAKFALENDRGDVVCYITPPQGTDLSRYAGQRIGVRGKKGFVPQMNARHIHANSITMLPDQPVKR